MGIGSVHTRETEARELLPHDYALPSEQGTASITPRDAFKNQHGSRKEVAPEIEKQSLVAASSQA